MSNVEKNLENVQELERLTKAEQIAKNDEKEHKFLVFDEKNVNKNFVLIAKVISNEKIDCIRAMNSKVEQISVSRKYSSLNTQIVALGIQSNDIFMIKYLGKKQFEGKTVNSFIVKKLTQIDGKMIYVSSKELQENIEEPTPEDK